MADISVTADEFSENFPEFSDVENIEIYLMRAACYIAPNGNGRLSGESRKLAIYLFTGHLLTLQKNITNGQMTSGITASATVHSVSVSMVPPPGLGAFEYWLNQTQYGAELLALLETQCPVPLLLGGSLVRTLF